MFLHIKFMPKFNPTDTREPRHITGLTIPLVSFNYTKNTLKQGKGFPGLLFLVFQPMGFFELVPFVMVYTAILI